MEYKKLANCYLLLCGVSLLGHPEFLLGKSELSLKAAAMECIHVTPTQALVAIMSCPIPVQF